MLPYHQHYHDDNDEDHHLEQQQQHRSSSMLSPGAGSNYFSVEDEAELAPAKTIGSDCSHTPLTWRGDPKETHSDWTIMVVTNELETISYHVHKSVLCFGSRHSRYFARLLNNNNNNSLTNPQSKKMTKIELDARDAAHFPILLDYVYAPCSYSSSLGTMPTEMSTLTSPSVLLSQSKSSEDEPSYMALGEDVNSRNAVSLRSLARRFEIDSLMLGVNRFIQRDLNFETGPMYLSAAHVYDDTRLLESATRLCVENFTSLDKKMLIKLPLDVFRNLVVSLQGYEQEDDTERSYFLSEVVCRYLEKHPQYITADLMLELTDPSYMPVISPDSAMGFTSLIKQLTPEDATLHWFELIPFSRRCARSVVRQYGWSDFSIDGAVDEYLRNCSQSHQCGSNLDSLLFATSFAAALDQAQEDYEGITNEQERMQLMLRNLDNTLNIMEKMGERKDRYLGHQLTALDEAQKKIVLLEKELAETKRQHQQQQQQMQQQQLQDQQQIQHQQQLQQQQIQQQQMHQQQMQQQQKQQRQQQQQQQQQQKQPKEQRQCRTPPPKTPPKTAHFASPLQSATPPQRSTTFASPSTRPSPYRGELSMPLHPSPDYHTKSLLDDDLSRSNISSTDSFSSFLRDDPAIRDLVSPQSIGTEVHRNKIHKMKEMRSKSDRSYCGGGISRS